MGRESARDEFARLYVEHGPALKTFVLRRVTDAQLAEDLVAETFVTAWRRLDRLPERGQQRQWLFNVAFHLISNYWRGRERRERLSARLVDEFDIESSDTEVPVDERTRILGAAMRQLSLDEQLLLEGSYWENLSYREFASNLAISENAVGSRLNRARHHLRDEINKLNDGR